MSFPFRLAAAVTGLSLAASVVSSPAATDPSNACQASKLKEAGKLAGCISKSLAKTTKAGVGDDTAALGECSTKFDAKLQSAESKADGSCPTEGDAGSLADEVFGLFERIDDNVTGERFIDRLDGTVMDTVQGVIWQKQTAGAGCESCVDESRSYGDVPGWLGALSDATTGLAGQRDWGLPTIEQLQSIVSCTELPCTFVNPVLGPNPTPAIGGSTYLLSGTTGFSTIPCFMVVKMEDGSVACLDEEDTQGSSRARIMNNAR